MIYNGNKCECNEDNKYSTGLFCSPRCWNDKYFEALNFECKLKTDDYVLTGAGLRNKCTLSNEILKGKVCVCDEEYYFNFFLGKCIKETQRSELHLNEGLFDDMLAMKAKKRPAMHIVEFFKADHDNFQDFFADAALARYENGSYSFCDNHNYEGTLPIGLEYDFTKSRWIKVVRPYSPKDGKGFLALYIVLLCIGSAVVIGIGIFLGIKLHRAKYLGIAQKPIGEIDEKEANI
ncbi:MAG: hypothetical protein MHMPM18_000664 [Marteilia pararefringens]